MLTKIKLQSMDTSFIVSPLLSAFCGRQSGLVIFYIYLYYIYNS